MQKHNIRIYTKLSAQIWTWNFNITAEDSACNISWANPTTGESISEFGVYQYTQIVSVGWPTITGNPGSSAINAANVTIQTRSNGNYSLRVDLDELDHDTNPGANIANTTVSLRGGDLALSAFGAGYLYVFGSGVPGYKAAENDGDVLVTNDLEYSILIPLATTPGDYTGIIRYRLWTEI